MKITKHKKHGFELTKLKDKTGPFYFNAEVFEDDSGFYEMKTRRGQLYCVENGTIDDWVDDVNDELTRLGLLRDFLVKSRSIANL